MSIKARIIAAFAATAFGQVVTIISQILLTPLFFVHWGAQMYGEWLILSTIPAYLIMADMGIGSAAANEMVLRVGSNDFDGARQTFWSLFNLLIWVGLLVIVVSGLVGFYSYEFDGFKLKDINRLDQFYIIVLFGLGIAVSFFSGLVSAAYRAAGKNALGITVGNGIRLIDIISTVIFLLMSYSPLILCFGTLILRFIAVLAQAYYLFLKQRWILLPTMSSDYSIIKRLLKPSMGFLASQLSSSFVLQAPILILGAAYGGASVAIFSAMRTLARVPIQFSNAFNSSVWPEMSFAFGAGNLELLRKLHRRSFFLVLTITLSITLILSVFGRDISNLWLRQTLHYDPIVLFILLGLSICNALWAVSSMVLVSANHHANFSFYYALINTISVAIMYFFTIHLGMYWFLLNMMLSEFLMIFIVMPRALALSDDNSLSFFSYFVKSFQQKSFI
jgi:O-antigen/teichoic acid export membrane protein